MKRYVTCIALTMSILIGTGMTPADADGRGPCSGWFSEVRPDMNRNGVAGDIGDKALVRHRVEHLIDCAVRIWPVAGGTYYARAIAERESGFWPWAQNPSSLCSGLYQHVLSLWPGRAQAFLRRDWFSPWRWSRGISVFDARANVLVSIRMAHAGGWGPWS